eukprot:366161-Chlamydomonas_euryale.AAC.5
MTVKSSAEGLAHQPALCQSVCCSPAQSKHPPATPPAQAHQTGAHTLMPMGLCWAKERHRCSGSTSDRCTHADAHGLVFRDEEKVSPGFNHQSCCSGVYRCWTIRLTGTNIVLGEGTPPLQWKQRACVRCAPCACACDAWEQGRVGAVQAGAHMQQVGAGACRSCAGRQVRTCSRWEPGRVGAVQAGAHMQQVGAGACRSCAGRCAHAAGGSRGMSELCRQVRKCSRWEQAV